MNNSIIIKKITNLVRKDIANTKREYNKNQLKKDLARRVRFNERDIDLILKDLAKQGVLKRKNKRKIVFNSL